MLVYCNKIRQRGVRLELDKPSTIENVTFVDNEMSDTLEKSGLSRATLPSKDNNVTLVNHKPDIFEDGLAMSESMIAR